ncbi:2-haloacid dehalogenase [Promicromonospora umidemergens]|uniref:haloacid dehalogenase type II n=1 Tax=Promicromonospora umidemergens TaxID=629679 RepID=UPI0020A42729|nr:haloacid dehalogenase type II [Promicromonospora umidemergens]MCP2285931.1 2-haloacid dehalogenase [Promicromonospora umidemergens]
MEPATTGTVRPTVVFDVLGTLVDQTGSMERRVSARTGADSGAAAEVARRWLGHVAEQERAIVEGRRAFEPSHELDREALSLLVSERLLSADDADRLADASEWLEPWPDTVAGLELLAADCTVLGLSNASRRVLAGLSTHAGLRWHQVLSAQDAGTYKPGPEVYEVAMASTPADSGVPFMVAAHGWDLRAAAAAGMRTAYVPRADGDPPGPGDTFDLRATNLLDLHAQLLDLFR